MHRMRSISAEQNCSLTAVHRPLRTTTPKICSFPKNVREFGRSNSDQFSPAIKSNIRPMREATLPGHPALRAIEGARATMKL
jgi:hypothetical protein